MRAMNVSEILQKKLQKSMGLTDKCQSNCRSRRQCGGSSRNRNGRRRQDVIFHSEQVAQYLFQVINSALMIIMPFIHLTMQTDIIILMGCMLSAASCNKWWMDEIIKTKEYSEEQEPITDDMLGE